MKHLKRLFHKIEVHPITLLYLMLAIVGGYLKWYLFAMGIVCIHETCHLLMACYFHFDIEKIEILPFGAYLSIKDFFYHSLSEELCVLLAGPCSHFFIAFFIPLTSSYVFKDYLETINKAIFLFNLMPIYPLDGARVVGVILQRIMDLKKAMFFHLKISVFAFSLLCVFYLRTNTIVMIIYLFFQQIFYAKFIPVFLRQYFIHIPLLKKRRHIVCHNDLTYRKGCMNYYIKGQKILTEREMVNDLLRSLE